MNSNEQVSEPVTTSAPQSQVEQQQSDIPVTSFCDINDLNSHFKNSNLRFNCGKKSCLGLVYFESSRIGSFIIDEISKFDENPIFDKLSQLNVPMEMFQIHQNLNVQKEKLNPRRSTGAKI